MYEGGERDTHGDVEDELLIGLAEEVRARRVQLAIVDDLAEGVRGVLVEAVQLLLVESLEQRDLHLHGWRTHRSRQHQYCTLHTRP